jgi:putative transcriptional regulator
MDKELFDNLVDSISQAGKMRKGSIAPSRTFEYEAMDIKRIRHRLEVSQRQFAMMIGVSMSTLQNWEQGRRHPEGPARALLRVVDKQPEAVFSALVDSDTLVSPV